LRVDGTGGRDGWTDRGSIRGPRGPKKFQMLPNICSTIGKINLATL